MGSYSVKLNPELWAEYKKKLENEDCIFQTPQYTFFQAKNKMWQLTFYKTGKVLVQGKEIDYIVKKYLDKNFETTAKKTEETGGEIAPYPHIGIDESGKGDFFGPLVVAGCYLTEENAKKMKQLGATDSKKLDDKKILALSDQIKEAAIFDIVVIGNKKYNELYAKFKNLNRLLAWGHSTVLENLLNKTDAKIGISDKFADEKVIINALKEKGKNINLRYKIGPSLSKVRDSLFSLLNGTRKTIDGSVQVLWYELAETNDNNTIREFQKINTGKIRLTDAELIKGLFLLKRNFEDSRLYVEQSQLAIEWEFIENALHSDKFWYFLQKKGKDLPNRIDLLFTLLYKMEALSGVAEADWDSLLKTVDKKLSDTRQSEIFRFFYERLEGKSGEELETEVSDSWKEVITLFRTLDDWYNTPLLYNNIGLLSQCGEDLSRLVMHFYSMNDDDTRDNFESYLVERIRYQLRNTKVEENEEGSKEITNQYREHDNIYKLLLTLNVQILNEQNQLLGTDADIYKFPFDVLNSQDWDIEHIDSFHTNALKRDSDKKEWIGIALKDREEELSEQEKEEINDMLRRNMLDAAITVLKKNSKEEADDETKSMIGNLTLLDSTTNRMYGNSLFCTKRRIIIERITKGVFVPIATQYVFSKFFDKKGTNRSYWTKEDMTAYNHFVYEKLKPYIGE